MILPDQLDPGMFYKKDGTERVVKLLSVEETEVSFTWFGINFTKDKEEFCKQYSFISVPGMQ